jgi:hypothetical protein
MSITFIRWPRGKEPAPEAVEKQRIKARYMHGDTYPSSTLPGGNKFPSYYRFSGVGPPPEEIGSGGDVYVDVYSTLATLYGRDRVRWVVWPGPDTLFPHPTLDDRYLWCSEERIAWYPGKFAVDDAKARPDQSSHHMIWVALQNESKGADDSEGGGGSSSQRLPEKIGGNNAKDRPAKRVASDPPHEENVPRKKTKTYWQYASSNGETVRTKDAKVDGSEFVVISDGAGSSPGGRGKRVIHQNQVPGGNLQDAGAKNCQRCPNTEARVVLLEGTVREMEERIAKGEGGNRDLEVLNKTLKEEVEARKQNILGLKAKLSEAEGRFQGLRSENALQCQQIATLTETREKAESSQQAVSSPPIVIGNFKLSKPVLDGLPSHVSQTLGSHIESREC